jgi:hypothetical protein
MEYAEARRQLEEASEQLKNPVLRQDFSSCFLMLQTCRQIYHEATRVVFGSNAFHCPREVSACLHFGVTHHKVALDWLSSLGTQFDLLSTITIDMKDLCEDYWWGNVTE